MSGVGAKLDLGIVLGWVVYCLSGFFLHAPLAAGLGIALGLTISFGLNRNLIIGGAIAVLAPFGVMLPALALASMAAGIGVEVVQFSAWELLAFLLLYTAFLTSAFGVIPVDIYRLGYAPLPVAGMVLAVCLYGLLTGNWFLSLVAVLGQVFWVMKWGSSNWFDYVLHVLLWPVALISLISRLF